MKRILYFHSPSPLGTFAEACLSLTPNLFVFDEHEIFLEIGGTQKLFGGEAGLLLKAETLAANFRLQKRMVLCDRPEWGRALSTAPEVVIPPGKSREALGRLPISRLGLCGDPHTFSEEEKEREKLVLFLRKVGLRTIGDFAALPATAVNRRFGKMGVLLREWVTGEKEFLLPPFFAKEVLKENVDADEVTSLDSLLLFLRQGLVKLELRLRGRALSAKKLQLTFNLESKNAVTRVLEVAHPTQDAQALLKLLKDFLPTVQWDSPLARLEIEVIDTLPWTPGQLSLLDKGENRFYDLAQYVGRLRARLGAAKVGFAEFQESYFPESSWKNVWPPSVKSAPQDVPNRPLFLFFPPKPCSPPKNWELIPSEDISSEWWERNDRRSYFVAKNPQGAQLWVYFDRQEREWFLHGVFD